MSQLGGYTGIPRDALAYLNAADPASPDVFVRRNLPRVGLVDSGGDAHVALASGVMTSVPFYLVAGDQVSSISAISGAVGANAPTNQWAALFSRDATPVLLGQSPDAGAAAWAANTIKSFALAAPFRIPTTGFYTVGIMVVATAAPSLIGALGARPIPALGERRLAQTSGAALTTTAPATVATPVVQNFVPYLVIS